MAAHGRLDEVNRRLTADERQLFDTSVAPPAEYAEYKAATDAILSDAAKAPDWLDVLAHSAGPTDSGERGQLEMSAQLKNRFAAYNAITRPLLVIGEADDEMIPAYLCREVADAVPGAQYVDIPDAGHFGCPSSRRRQTVRQPALHGLGGGSSKGNQ